MAEPRRAARGAPRRRARGRTRPRRCGGAGAVDATATAMATIAAAAMREGSMVAQRTRVARRCATGPLRRKVELLSDLLAVTAPERDDLAVAEVADHGDARI